MFITLTEKPKHSPLSVYNSDFIAKGESIVLGQYRHICSGFQNQILNHYDHHTSLSPLGIISMLAFVSLRTHSPRVGQSELYKASVPTGNELLTHRIVWGWFTRIKREEKASPHTCCEKLPWTSCLRVNARVNTTSHLTRGC